MFKKIALGSAAIAVVATAVIAGSHAGPHDAAIKARKSHMQLYSHNLGLLGGMAQSKIEYDAGAAQAAATNLALLSQISQARYWPQGSDNSAVEGTRALPALWEDMSGVMAAAGKVTEAAAAMDAAAGNGLEALQGAMGALGGACGGCHKAYRVEQ